MKRIISKKQNYLAISKIQTKVIPAQTYPKQEGYKEEIDALIKRIDHLLE